MAHVSRALLWRRFVQTCREDGVWTALSLTAGYLKRRYLSEGFARRWSRVRADDAGYLVPVWRTLAQEGAFQTTAAPATLHKRRQIALIGDLNLPQCRKYRVEQLAAFWAARDVDVEFAHYTDVPRATRILQLATHAVEYRLPDLPVTQMLRYEARRLGLPVLYDIDDPLFSVSAYATYGNMVQLPAHQQRRFLAAAPGYAAMMNGADAISVSTPGLAAEAACHTQRPVFLRRNFADRQTLDAGRDAGASRPPADGRFRIAFASGSKGHEADFAVVADAVEEVLGTHSKAILMILGYFDMAQLPAAIRGQTRSIPFRDYAGYLMALAQCDCALVPLADDPFNRCKSAVRVLDAAAASVPCIASPVGDLATVIRDGDTGWVAANGPEWQTTLDRLIRDPDRAREAGVRARAHVERYWSLADTDQIASPALLNWIEA